MNVWECPNARGQMDEFYEILKTGQKHIVYILPRFRMAGFAAGFCEFSRRYYDDAAIAFCENNDIPVDCLGRFFGEDAGKTLNELMEKPASHITIMLVLPGNPDEKCAGRWIDFFQQLGAASKSCLERGYPLLWHILAVVPAQMPEPKPESALEFFLGSGIWRSSDLEYVVEQNIRDYEISAASSRLWLYALCLGLGRSDPGVCNAIFEAMPMNEEEILAMLASYEYEDLNDELKAAVIALDGGAKKISWHELTLLRDYGILDFDADGKESLHPAALCRARRPQPIKRMVVQGQIRVYLPLVQEVHHFIQGRLKKLWGENWHKFDEAAFPNIQIDMGPLCAYMNKYLRGQCGADLLELARMWRDVRHTLAHGNILDFDTARSAVMLYEQMSGI